MEYVGNKLCISHGELTAGIMSKSTIDALVRRGRVEQVRKGGNGREAIYVVESFPFKHKAETYRRYPDPRKDATHKTLAEVVELDGVAHAFFAAHTFDNGQHIPDDVQAEYTANASILNLFRGLLDKANSHRGKQGARRLKITEFWQDKAAILPILSEVMPNTLPGYYKNLQRVYNRYIIEGYSALVSPRFNNNNADKAKDPEQKALIIRLLADHRNWDNAQVADLYNFIAKRCGWEPLADRAIGYLRKKYDLPTAAARHGASEFYNKRAMQVKRDRPTAPLLFWTADGWDVELYYQQAGKNGDGYRVTTYGNRLTVVVVLDPFNNYPLGYAIGDKENTKLIRAAMQNAIDHTRELFGVRYRTNQLQTDHYGIKTLTPLYCALADKVTPARVKNAKAKVIEPYFNYLNKTYFQFFDNWSGFGITSGKDKQPNADILNKNRHSFPDEQGCRRQIIGVMELERQKKRADYLAGFEHTPAERRLPMADEMYLLNFGATTGHKNAIESKGLLVTINGQKGAYDCFNPKFREFAHVRWTVKYDPADLSKILATNDDGSLRFMLESKYHQPMALADRKDGDAEQLARVQQFNNELEASVTERLIPAYETTERLILEHPDLRNSYAKALLCDSRGQHKDQRNNRRRTLEAPIDLDNLDVKVVAPRAPAANKDESIFEIF